MDGIKAEKLSKSYGDKKVINEMSFFIPYGSCVQICGASGKGKTTLLRLIAGIEDPDSGTISGADKGEISFLFQDDRLLPFKTVLENVSIVIKEKSRKNAAREILEELGLGKELDAYPHELSGGMRRRVAIARALVYDRNILILDEALRGLDEGNLLRTAEVIEKHSEGKTVIFVTHGEPITARSFERIEVI